MRYAPKDYQLTLEIPELGIEIYTQGSCMMAYGGKRQNYDIYCQYKSVERMQEVMNQYVQGIRDRAERKVNARAEQKQQRQNAIQNLKVGDIFKASWGYDQTNVDYYQLVAIKGQVGYFRKIGQMSEETAYLSGQCVPAQNCFVGEVFTKRIQAYKDRPYIRINSVANAYYQKPIEVGGVKVYEASYWSAYA